MEVKTSSNYYTSFGLIFLKGFELKIPLKTLDVRRKI